MVTRPPHTALGLLAFSEKKLDSEFCPEFCHLKWQAEESFQSQKLLRRVQEWLNIQPRSGLVSVSLLELPHCCEHKTQIGILLILNTTEGHYGMPGGSTDWGYFESKGVRELNFRVKGTL